MLKWMSGEMTRLLWKANAYVWSTLWVHKVGSGTLVSSNGWYSPGVGSREGELPAAPGLASECRVVLGQTGELRGSGARSLERIGELGVLPSMELLAEKWAAVSVTLGCVSTGCEVQAHVGRGSRGGEGSNSLSQMLGRVSFRLARASWLPCRGCRASLSESGATVAGGWYSWL